MFAKYLSDIFGSEEDKRKFFKKEEKVESQKIACIFKVFDDIRQDTLALQIIGFFKHVFEKVGLDVYLYPYNTISNRSGAENNIGGIIQCIKNTMSRDQIGKITNANLYQFFI